MMRRTTLATWLAAASLAAGTASAEVAVTNRFTPATTEVSGVTTYEFVVNSTEVTALTNTSLTHTLSGVVSLDTASATSTCGGTFSASGPSLTWAGATVPAAPASGASSCTVRVPVRLGPTPNSYITTIPADAVTNDQGRSNRYESKASINLTPLQMFQVSKTTLDPMISGRDVGLWYFIQSPVPRQVGLTIRNPNAITLNATANMLTVPLDFKRPVISGPGCSATFTLLGAYNSYQADNLVVPGGASCLVTFDVDPSDARYDMAAGPYTDALNRSLDTVFTTVTFQTGTVTQDTSLNGRSVQPYGYRAVPVSVVKGINDVKAASAGGGQDLTVTFLYELKNRTSGVRTVTFTDPLGSFFDLSAGTVSVTSTEQASGACTAAGVRLQQSPNAAVFEQVKIPAYQVCTYRLTTRLPAGALSGLYTSTLRNNQISTDLAPSTPNTEVASTATLSVLTDGQATLDAPYSYQYSDGSYRITLRNPTTAAFTGVAFNETWDHTLEADLSRSYSTCGGSLSLPAGRRGLNFTGGTVAPGATCKVVIAIDPATLVGPRSYPNTLPAITTTSGQAFVPTAGTVNLTPMPSYLVNTAQFGNLPTHAPTGAVQYVEARHDNTADAAQVGRPMQLILAAGERLVGDIIVTCEALPEQRIAQSSITRTGDTYSFAVNIPAQPRSTGPVDEVGYVGGTRCYFRAPITSDEAGAKLHRFNAPDQPAGTPQPVYTQNMYILGLTWVTDAQYTVNLSFSPQALYAGQTAQMTLSALSPANSAGTDALNARIPFRIVTALPDGIQVSPEFLATARRTVDRNGWSVITYRAVTPEGVLSSVCDADRSCSIDSELGTLVSPDGRTVIQYVPGRMTPNALPVVATRFGDLTTTIRAADTQPLPATASARIIGDTSASLKVLPAIVAQVQYGPNRIVSGQQSQLRVSITNANPVRDLIRVRVPLPAMVTPADAPLAGCAGALSRTYDAGTRELVITGVALESNEACTLLVPVTGTTGQTTATTTTTVPAGYVTGPVSNTGNQVATSASLTVDPLPMCVARGHQGSTQTVLLTSPGTGTAVLRYVNNGGQDLKAGDATWGMTWPLGYSATYSFDGRTAAGSPQEAWAQRVAETGALRPQETAVLTVRYAAPEGKSGGSSDQASVDVKVGACALADSQDLVIVQAEGTITKSQAVCAVRPDGTLTCGPLGTETMQVEPCSVLKYQLDAVNRGTAPLLAARIREPLSGNVSLLGLVAHASPTGALLYSTDGAAWSAVKPTAGSAVYVAVDTNGDGQVTRADGLQAGQTLTVTLYVRVAGRSCAPVTTPIQE